jgi:hypothetical protein
MLRTPALAALCSSTRLIRMYAWLQVYKPELTRLDAKADGVIRDLSMLDLTVRQILVSSG